MIRLFRRKNNRQASPVKSRGAHTGEEMFDKLKSIMEMQKKAREIKESLDKTVFDTESQDGSVRLCMNGSQQVEAVTVRCETLPAEEKARLEKALKDVYNRAIKHSHDLAAQKMKEITGLNIPGLM